MKSGFDKTYKDLLKNSSIDPPDEVWSSISENLDLDNVWSNISSDLDYQSVLRFENIGIISSFVAILAAFYIWSFPPNYGSEDLIVANREVPKVEMEPKIPPDHGLSSKDESLPETNNLTPSLPNPLKGDMEESIIPALLDDEREDIIIPEESTSVDVAKSVPLLFEVKTPDPINVSLKKIDPTWEIRETSIIPSNKNRRGGYFLGLTGSIKNTWIINDKTISGFSSQELHSTKPILGREFGLQAGLAISKRLNVSGEYHFTSNYAQAYNEYIDGRYGTTNFNVDYNKVYLLAGYRLNPGSINRSVELLLGPYIGILKSASESFNDSRTDYTSSYKTHIFGITAGFQKPYPLFEKLDLLMGVRASYGLNNIYKGTSTVPASFRITHPASLGLTLGLRYYP